MLVSRVGVKGGRGGGEGGGGRGRGAVAWSLAERGQTVTVVD